MYYVYELSYSLRVVNKRMASPHHCNGSSDDQDLAMLVESSLRESLASDLGALLVEEPGRPQAFDLEFVAGSGPKQVRVKAHRLIVLCRCGRLAGKRQQWLRSGAGEQKVVSVRLERFEPRTVKSIVRYLYTSKVGHRTACMCKASC